jgi:transcriptional regulator with PAS, ATPase and Fis domain
MALKALKFFPQKVRASIGLSAFGTDGLKEVQRLLGLDEILLVHGTSCKTLFMFSEEIVPQKEDVIEALSRTFKETISPVTEAQIIEGQQAVTYFFILANGMDNSSCQQNSVKSFVNDFTLAKQSSHIGAVIQRLFQRSIWLHERVRLNTSYFNINLDISGIFCELSGKIFETLNTLTVQIEGCLPETHSVLDGLYRSGCRRFLFSGNSEDFKCLVEKCISPLNIIFYKNKLSDESDIFINNNAGSTLLDIASLKHRMAQKNNAPFLILDSTGKSYNQKLTHKFYSAYFYNYTDLERAIEKNKIEQEKIFKEVAPWIKNEVDKFYAWLSSDSRYRFMGIIGRSPKMQNLFEIISRISQTDITVLIQGASGTGKELVSHAVHKLSSRAHNPFVVVNCGAIPENLLESELFGHVRGSFTGAVSDKKGMFFEADQGTIFLDEIAELPQQLQVKLLRFLQEGDIKPVGSNATLKVDVRVIAATNKNLYEMVKQGGFRSDLFYRLNVMMLELPSLNERKEDIIILADYFLKKYARKFKKEVSGFSKKTIQYFLAYDWPGNIRELENAVEHAVALSLGTEVIEFDLPQSIRGARITVSNKMSFAKITLKDVEKNHILNTLNSSKWVYDKACKILGIGRTTLWRKLKEYDVKDIP